MGRGMFQTTARGGEAVGISTEPDDEASLVKLFEHFLKSDVARCSSAGGILLPHLSLNLFDSHAKLKAACYADVKASPLTLSYDTFEMGALSLKSHASMPDICDRPVFLSQFNKEQLKNYFKIVKHELETRSSPLLDIFTTFKHWVNGTDQGPGLLFDIAAPTDALAEALALHAAIGKFWAMQRIVKTPGEHMTMAGFDTLVKAYCDRKNEMHKGAAFRHMLANMGFTRPCPHTAAGVAVHARIPAPPPFVPLVAQPVPPPEGQPAVIRDLNAFVISTCKKWEGMHSKSSCKNCGLRNLHIATDCNKPRSADLPCQHCYGLDFASAPHHERDCQGCSEVNRPLYQRLQHLFFQKRVNGTYQAPAPAAAPVPGAAGNGGP
mmetsp:Transcript_86167/g.126054  ORF Transcript_86167/g.126054 Transcript_86167/m.126054 type:complete len:379 (-) Transcript_86167:315-1451(-)